MKFSLEAELEAIESAAEERERYLRIAETLQTFRGRLRASAETLDVIERQKVLRSLVKEVLVGDGEITILHSIPMTEGSGSSHGKPASNSSRQSPGPRSYLLRWGSDNRPCCRTSCSTNWTESWSDADCGSHGTRMTAIYMWVVAVPGNE